MLHQSSPSAVGADEKEAQLEVFPIGLDIIIDENNQIQILEMQSIYTSNLKRISHFKGPDYDVLKQLTAAIKKKYSELKLDDGDLRAAQGQPTLLHVIRAKSREGSMGGKEKTIPNRGIEPILDHKWLFDRFCNQSEALKKYIPETVITTIGTIGAGFPCSKLASKTQYIFKPGDLSGGNGVHVLPATKANTNYEQAFLDKLGENLKEACTKEGCWTSHAPFFPYLPIVIQKYLGPRPVIRVYAIVAANVANSELKLATTIDTASAYCHILKRDSNDFTLQNNEHESFKIENNIKEQIQQFLDTFFKILLKDKKQATYKEWETLANEYILNCKKWNDGQRADNLAQFAAALMQEQSYTQNKLSAAQCNLLETFLARCKEQDTKLFSPASPLGRLIMKAFAVLAGANLTPYQNDHSYKLVSIVSAYHAILLSMSPSHVSAFVQAVRNYAQQQKPLTQKSTGQKPVTNKQEPPKSELTSPQEVLKPESKKESLPGDQPEPSIDPKWPIDDEGSGYYRRCFIS